MLAFTRQCFVNTGAISASEAFGHLLPTALEQCSKPPLVDDYAGLYQNPLGEYHQYIDTNTIYWGVSQSFVGIPLSTKEFFLRDVASPHPHQPSQKVPAQLLYCTSRLVAA
jgi:hypothetical protein